MPEIHFAHTANPDVVSARSRAIILEMLLNAGCPSCLVTSTSRTPEQQARAMYANIVATSVAKQRALYAAAGDRVIDEYVDGKNAGLSEDAIVAAMTARIVALGPPNVSKHCADPKTLNVIDIAPSSLADAKAFLAAIQAAETAGKVARFFSPGSNDPAFHVEIPQP